MPNKVWMLSGTYDNIAHCFNNLHDMLVVGTVEGSRKTIALDIPRSRFLGTQKDYDAWCEAWRYHASGCYIQGDMMGHFFPRVLVQNYAQHYQYRHPGKTAERYLQSFATLGFGLCMNNRVAGFALSIIKGKPEYWMASFSESSNKSPSECQLTLVMSTALYKYLSSSDSDFALTALGHKRIKLQYSTDLQERIKTIASLLPGKEKQLLPTLFDAEAKVNITVFSTLIDWLEQRHLDYTHQKPFIGEFLKALLSDDGTKQKIVMLTEHSFAFIRYLLLSNDVNRHALFETIKSYDQHDIEELITILDMYNYDVAIYLLQLYLNDNAPLANHLCQALRTITPHKQLSAERQLTTIDTLCHCDNELIEKFNATSCHNRQLILRIIDFVEMNCQKIESTLINCDEKYRAFRQDLSDYKHALYAIAVSHLSDNTTTSKKALQKSVKIIHHDIAHTLSKDRAKWQRRTLMLITNTTCVLSGIGMLYNLSNQYYNQQLLFFSEPHSRQQLRKMESGVINTLFNRK